MSFSPTLTISGTQVFVRFLQLVKNQKINCIDISVKAAVFKYELLLNFKYELYYQLIY